jgi:hypothetical protein
MNIKIYFANWKRTRIPAEAATKTAFSFEPPFLKMSGVKTLIIEPIKAFSLRGVSV